MGRDEYESNVTLFLITGAVLLKTYVHLTEAKTETA